MIKSVCSIALIMLACLVSAQGKYSFRNYAISEGLSQSSVATITQDKYGALWIGTQDGLNRFDGAEFEVFNSDNTPSISSNYFTTSTIDESGSIWFGTSNGLLNYIPQKETFESHILKDRFTLHVTSIADDGNGKLWLGTASNGICVFSKDKKKFNFFIAPLVSSKIEFLAFIDQKSLFVSSEDKGAMLVDVSSKKIKPVKISGKQKSFVRVNLMKKVRDKYLLGTNQGLYIYHPETREAKPYLSELEERFGLIDVTDIWWEEQTSKLFVTSKTHGLLTISIKGDIKILQHTQDIFQKNALANSSINAIFKDKSGTFWVATERGISSFSPYNNGFFSVGPSGSLSQGIPSPGVWCFAEDKEANYLFIGTDNAVSRYDHKHARFDQFFRNGFDGDQHEGSVETAILSLHVISEKELLVGTTEGLQILRIESPNRYRYEKLNYEGLANPANFERTYYIVHWKEKKYFLATKGGVLLYDHEKGSVQPFEHNPVNASGTISAGACRFAFKDKRGRVWFTTSVGGLNVLEERDGSVAIVPYKYNETIRLLSRNYITTIYQSDERTFWMGTMGSGMIQLDLESRKAHIYNKKNGLPNNVVYGILADKNKALWLSTNKGIARFDLQERKIVNHAALDRLAANEYNQGAYLRSANGFLYFGNINGYNYFDPGSLQNKSKYTRIVFTKFKLDENWIRPGDTDKLLSRSISETKRIELNYRQRSFTIRFMVQDLSNPDLVNYKYILEGSDEGEIEIGNTNQIHFNSLQPGDYKLKVYARTGAGEWNPVPAQIEISLAAPFWRTVGFWVVVAVIVALFIIVVARKRIEEERREQVLLEMKIAERTREIREQNIKIEKQKETIEEKKNRLEEQKRLLEVEKEKTEKLLKNIIPESTYQELKTKGKASARAYKTVSVLFTDFVGFTKIAEKMSPSDLVSELDIYFRKFDEIIVRNNLEKIKTIGDAYMCAGGVPVRNNTNPIDACLAALQIQESMDIMRQEARQSGRIVWELRLGINTGEVTAGVIGSEKLAYDIWGATVNQAQRMEMLGEPGKVTVSGQTFVYVEPYFSCTFKGKVKSKSKGLIDMYTVDGIKPELSVDGKGLYPNDRFHQIVNLHHYSSINYYKAERHIMKLLEKKLSPKLHYHSIAHTKDVCRAVERLALLEGVTDEGLFLLKSAATYHDAGFVEIYDKNEPVGARMAGEILPKYGYTDEHIERIRELIYVTEIPHKPKSKLEEIICDADLDYLGRDDFHEIADKLRRELREHGKIDSDRKWDEIQVMFLTNHKYFTETAIQTRQAKKEQNLQDIKDRLEKNDYKD
ncbi:MAG: hypothetical protein EP338_00590 [Bacteroidetes bacterium]|nr:MAG: hypothetical protein EP338_00590 [Bacteroidota bacterium]